MSQPPIETAPEGPALERRAGTVDGNRSRIAASSDPTVPREGGTAEVSTAVQIVREFGAPESHGSIRCAPWCTDGRGHLDAIMRSDQVCWAPSNAVVLGLAEGAPALPIALEDWAQLDPPHIAVATYKGWHGVPVVDVHLYHPHENPHISVDFNTKLTAAEAVQLARFLLDSAALAGAWVADDGR